MERNIRADTIIERDNTGKFALGHIGYNKGKRLKTIENCTPSTLHRFVVIHLGKPRKCDHCGTTDAKKYDWANKSQEYKHQLDDWLRLCRKCHQKYDAHKVHHNKKSINQYTLTGEYIKTWDSARQIERELGFNYTNISAACRGVVKKSNGFIWKFSEL